MNRNFLLNVFELLIIPIFLFHSSCLADRDLKQSNGIFSYKLYQKILEDTPTTDFVVSPFSALADLSMAYLGARGATATELQRGLELSGTKASIGNAFHDLLAPLQNSASVLKVVNKIYPSWDETVNSNYIAAVTRDFFSSIQSLNFGNADQSSRIINAYVANHTNNLITDLIQPSMLSPDTKLILVNAVYFKSVWQFPFNKRATAKNAFYTTARSIIQVDTMHLTKNLLYADLPEFDAQIVGLAYKDQAYCLHVIIPNDLSGLSQLETRLNNIDLSTLTDRMDFKLISLYMPKFTTKFKTSLVKPLQELGIRTAFTGSADFGDLLVDSQNVGISDVVHQAYIKVDEGGTEAAAATGIIMSRMAAFAPIPEEPLEIRLNHPFFYYLENQDQIVLFVGKYTGNA